MTLKSMQTIKTMTMSPIITEILIKTTMRYHPTPLRMATINKSITSKCWPGCGETGVLLHCWWECRVVLTQCKTLWRYLNKLKMGLTFDPAILLLGIYMKEPKTQMSKNTCTPMFTAALFTITEIWKQSKCPLVGEWIKQLWNFY